MRKFLSRNVEYLILAGVSVIALTVFCLIANLATKNTELIQSRFHDADTESTCWVFRENGRLVGVSCLPDALLKRREE